MKGTFLLRSLIKSSFMSIFFTDCYCFSHYVVNTVENGVVIFHGVTSILSNKYTCTCKFKDKRSALWTSTEEYYSATKAELFGDGEMAKGIMDSTNLSWTHFMINE